MQSRRKTRVSYSAVNVTSGYNSGKDIVASPDSIHMSICSPVSQELPSKGWYAYLQLAAQCTVTIKISMQLLRYHNGPGCFGS